jgi:hypothetical protein
LDCGDMSPLSPDATRPRIPKSCICQRNLGSFWLRFFPSKTPYLIANRWFAHFAFGFVPSFSGFSRAPATPLRIFNKSKRSSRRWCRSRCERRSAQREEHHPHKLPRFRGTVFLRFSIVKEQPAARQFVVNPPSASPFTNSKFTISELFPAFPNFSH